MRGGGFDKTFLLFYIIAKVMRINYCMPLRFKSTSMKAFRMISRSPFDRCRFNSSFGYKRILIFLIIINIGELLHMKFRFWPNITKAKPKIQLALNHEKIISKMFGKSFLNTGDFGMGFLVVVWDSNFSLSVCKYLCK